MLLLAGAAIDSNMQPEVSPITHPTGAKFTLRICSAGRTQGLILTLRCRLNMVLTRRRPNSLEFLHEEITGVILR